MTVEQLIELLQREYPQSPVLIEAENSVLVPDRHWLEDCSLLEPCRVWVEHRSQVVRIGCVRHNC